MLQCHWIPLARWNDRRMRGALSSSADFGRRYSKFPNRILTVELVRAMPFSSFDPDTIHLLNAAWCAAMCELRAIKSDAISTDCIAETVLRLNRNLRVAAAAGERDPMNLKQFALKSIADTASTSG